MFADGSCGHISAFQIGRDRPGGQRGQTAPAGDQLQNGDGQLRLAPRGLDTGGRQHAADQIQALLRHGIGDERFGGEIPGQQEFLFFQRMTVGHERQHFVGEQRLENRVLAR